MVPLRNHSHFTLLMGVSRPKDIANRCVELGYKACSLTDHGNIGCAAQFVGAMKDKGIKPILGCEFDLEGDHKHKVVVLAKNLLGWKSLITACSRSRDKEHYKPRPHIELEELARIGNGNFIVLSGYPRSEVADAMFIDAPHAYNQTNYNQVVSSSFIQEDWADKIKNEAGKYINLFGKDNFYLAIEVIDPENNPAALIVAKTMRWLSKKEGIPRVAAPPSFYPTNTEENASDQRVLLASLKKTTIKEMQKRINNGTDWLEFRPHFKSHDYYIPCLEEIRKLYDKEEIENTDRISLICEDYDIRNSPILPSFPCPDGMGPNDYLLKLCRENWCKKIPKDKQKDEEYIERVKRELGVIKEAGLASYFLIVQDYCNWARRQGMIMSVGRGSSAGSIVSYLIGITGVDPIQYGLLFERFYNAGRNSKNYTSLPDIDCDFPVSRRREVVEYLKSKYGDDKVANIATFNSMKGRGALTDVLRAHSVNFEEVKRITSNIPEEARISEELQAMKDRGDKPSSIRYALEIDPDSFKDWVQMDKEGKCSGIYGPYFEQAMRLEGVKRNISMHAAGVVMASTPLEEMCPLVYDGKIDGAIAGMEYTDLESMGLPKFDILGVAALDRIQGIIKLLRYGEIDD